MVVMNKEFEAALFLFDGNEEKATIFMNLLKDTFFESPVKYDIKMDFSEPSCRWCDNGECWYFMPDSRFRCEHNKKTCDFYENS